jgi:hypothetical protein
MNVALVPRIRRMTSPDLDDEHVASAIAWLDERWRGDPYVPDEFLPLVAAV